jgi:hypothetical protein
MGARPMEPNPPTPPKVKRTLPEALRRHQFQKGQKPPPRKAKPAAPGTVTPAAMPEATVTAANAGAVTVRRVGLLQWLGI